MLILGLVSSSLNAKNYRAVPLEKATLLKTGKEKMYCSICGMTLPMFYKTNHASKHDGHDDQYCSITCEITDMIVNHRKMSDFRVVDNAKLSKTYLKFIDANKAFFVVGSKKPGTMSMISKYAFSTQKSAQKFQKANGGKMMDFKELVAMVKAKLHKDLEATKKRQAKAIKMGQMMYKKICQKIDKKFSSTAEAKSYLMQNKDCGNIRGKKLQAIGLYLVNRDK
jgi:nitrous oxide reductase accessory protein NosL